MDRVGGYNLEKKNKRTKGFVNKKKDHKKKAWATDSRDLIRLDNKKDEPLRWGIKKKRYRGKKPSVYVGTR